MGLLEILIRDFGLKREKKKGKPKKKPAQWMGLACHYVEKSMGQAFEEPDPEPFSDEWWIKKNKELGIK